MDFPLIRWLEVACILWPGPRNENKIQSGQTAGPVVKQVNVKPKLFELRRPPMLNLVTPDVLSLQHDAHPA
jgi:hypothetical protein